MLTLWAGLGGWAMGRREDYKEEVESWRTSSFIFALVFFC